MSEKKMKVIFMCLVFKFVKALTIDNQLTIVRNDCYERLALGHKLSSHDVDKEFQLSTVQECQLACTEEGDKCRSFSFGVGVKGNATCSLSKHTVKETPDLKPIGTIIDVEYDLYIKKLGCKLVLNENQPHHSSINEKLNGTADPYQNNDPYSSNKPYRVQSSMISISSGPVHSEEPSRYGGDQTQSDFSDRPPFLPTRFNRPYKEHHRYPNLPQSNDRFDFDLSPHLRPNSYDVEVQPYRPNRVPTRPRPGYLYPNEMPNRPDDYHYKPYSPSRPIQSSRPDHLNEGYNANTNFRPNEIPDRPNGYGSISSARPIKVPERPIDSNGYGSLSPNRPIKIPDRPIDSNGYGSFSPSRPDKIPQRPIDFIEYGYIAPNRPIKIPERPIDSNGYGSVPPSRPVKIPDRPIDSNGYGPFSPSRPIKIPERPIDSSDYGSFPSGHPNGIPDRPIDSAGYGSLSPNRPVKIPEQPIDFNGYGSSSPSRPIQIPDRPIDSNAYGFPTPSRPIKVPQRPIDSNGYGSLPPNRPIKIPERPTHSSDYGSIPVNRPIEIPERPIDSGYGALPPVRPIKIPHRPVENNGYNSGNPYRPNRIPNRPDNYYDGPDTIKPGDHRPWPPIDGYDEFKPHRPGRPSYQEYESNYLDGYESKPYRPSRPHRPLSDEYEMHQRPYYHGSKPESGFDGYAAKFDEYDYIPPRHHRDRPKSGENPASANLAVNKTENATTAASLNHTTNGVHENRAPIVTETRGPYGNTITAILTEIEEACFRRVLAGKRVLRSFVRKAVPCERVEDCQRECSDERRFVCEGFNYRLDPTGRNQGDCELLEVPLSRLSIREDVVSDPEYDYYERDRNSDGPDCKGTRYYGTYSNRREDYHYDYRARGDYDNDYFDDSDRYYDRYRPPYPGTYNDFLYYDDHRGGKSYKYDRDYYEFDKADNVRPDYKSYEPYLPYWYREPDTYERDKWYKYYEDRLRDKEYWGFKDQTEKWGSYGGSYGSYGSSYGSYGSSVDVPKYDYQSKYNDSGYTKYYAFPYEDQDSKDWGLYGGTYGYGGYQDMPYNHKDSYNYWGLGKLDEDNALLPPYESKPDSSGSYLPPYDKDRDILDIQHGYDTYGYDNRYVKDQCSLRMATGFRLNKGTIRKIISVPHIYECEVLCHKEKDFPCSSYTFRYTLINNAPKENCHLSDRNYKELDYYTDLEPDRDCDVYTINNRNKCVQSITTNKESSDCFWRVRSSQRLDQRVVRDSLTVKSIVDCQLECVRSSYFTCRAFSFRYGSPSIGGAIDNCQLTDWPARDLNPRVHFVPEIGYEIYERRSYGHGCEAYSGINHKPIIKVEDKMDQLCYVGYGTQAKLLPQATKKSLWTATEADCKAECTRVREKGEFQCMSFSYSLSVPKGSLNCDLSDILQRDLLSNVDYIIDQNSWLFAWDLHNPQCVSIIVVGSTIFGGEHLRQGHDREEGTPAAWDPTGRPQDTWRVYTVSGYPCKRGNFCQENTVAGFWYCEVDGRDELSWDYCCKPDHHCGYSEGFPYQWCYVGPKKTQWRKCNERYYPYSSTDKYDYHHVPSYLPDTTSNHLPPSTRPSFRPDRPPPPSPPPLHNQYLDPPKPGGFGQMRHWPISYLHKELPQNDSLPDLDPTLDLQKLPKARNIDNHSEAIGNVIKVIQSNELKNAQYQILNATKSENDSAPFKIPIPLNTNQEKALLRPFQTVDLSNDTTTTGQNQRKERSGKPYARAVITKTNRPVTNESLSKSEEKVSL